MCQSIARHLIVQWHKWQAAHLVTVAALRCCMRVVEYVIEEALCMRVPPLEEGMREGITISEKAAGAKHAR